jgi:endo-1,4-beta-mannosidase
MSQAFLTGVNYWSRQNAMYFWKNFNLEHVQADFALIESLGMKIVRIFLLWDDFQPTPDSVSSTALTHLVQLADVAAKHQLLLDITFFTGHMSGPNWSPLWLLNGEPVPTWQRHVVSRMGRVNSHYENPYVHPIALKAEELLISTVVSTLKDHPAVWMWNLGNEPDLFAYPPTHTIGKTWSENHMALIRSIDDQHKVTCGLHADSLIKHNGLRVHEVFAQADVSVMHSYPMYSDVARHPLDPDFVPFTCALTAALSGKPILMEEFGGCTTAPGKPSETWYWTAFGQARQQWMASETDFADYIGAVLNNLVEVGATGAVMWCFADYVPELWHLPPCDEAIHERFFGLVRPDGSLKPHAEVIRRFNASKPTVKPIPTYAQLQVTPESYYEAPYDNFKAQYERYLAGKSISA